jgi:16S rRNA (uracil1498-N3)-methyltransferase
MPEFDFAAPRLFVDAALREGEKIALERNQSNYLGNVLRLSAGESILVFNGRDGEWRAEIDGRKRPDGLTIVARTRPQDRLPDIAYVFAPLKHARLDYMVQKAVEMGVGRLRPVLTRRTQVSRVNLDRMRANVIEAAEQCGILSVPTVEEAQDFAAALDTLEPGRLLVFCDEGAPVANPMDAMSRPGNNKPKLAVIVGPEGGFTDEERVRVAARENCVRVSLGPRILRADTAAVAVLAIVQSAFGDWRR